MRDWIQRQARRVRAAVMGLFLLGLVACGSTPPKSTDVGIAPPTELPPEHAQDVSLDLPPSQFSPVFQQAEIALVEFDWMHASVVLQEVPQYQLGQNDATHLAYLLARIAFIRGNQNWAKKRLDTLDQPGVHPALRYRVLSFERHLLELEGDYMASARLADQLLHLTPQANRASLRRELWRNLQRVDLNRLRATPIPTAETIDPAEEQWLAWLELARISRVSQLTLAEDLSTWQQANPAHPAAQALPGGLEFHTNSTANFGRVALILPLSGRLAPAGRAVLDGYLAAYYSARAGGLAPYAVHVLDHSQYSSANEAYEQALTEGAELVIGPLGKEGVADLALRLDRPVPVLALNTIDRNLPTGGGSALVQLSLNPQDEARRIAELAYGQGARRAVLATPTGEWGNKVEAALRERWKELGGSIASSTRYAEREEYTRQLKDALGISDSELRAQNVRDMLAENIEFTQRRRQDPDVIFLLSRNVQQARSLKPLLAFLYAGNLPVYAMSSIYNGVVDERNRDLNGVRLVETPWLLGANPELRVAIAAGDTSLSRYTRLNALGADAFLLQSNFQRLNAGADALLRGNTGLLSMDPRLQIHRELSPATFDGGELRPQ